MDPDSKEETWVQREISLYKPASVVAVAVTVLVDPSPCFDIIFSSMRCPYCCNSCCCIAQGIDDWLSLVAGGASEGFTGRPMPLPSRKVAAASSRAEDGVKANSYMM